MTWEELVKKTKKLGYTQVSLPAKNRDYMLVKSVSEFSEVRFLSTGEVYYCCDGECDTLTANKTYAKMYKLMLALED